MVKCHPYVVVHPYYKTPDNPEVHPSPLAAGAATWTVPELCKAYEWPEKLAGNGVIAIIELGGGYTAADLKAYFAMINQPEPTVFDVSVDGTKNDPGKSDDDIEVALDIEVAAASFYVATGRPAQIHVYWSQDIASAVELAAEDGCSVCSISWGADEAEWGEAEAKKMQNAAAAANAVGMIVFAAAGDNDSSDGGPNPANVDVPAACPNVVACGGTSKPHIGPEVVWNNNPGQSNGEGTGGGFSRFFVPMPSWQESSGAPKPPAGRGRMVPDLAANADPNHGYQIFVQGAEMVVGGTSAVAPLMAGLFVAFGEKLGDISMDLWFHYDTDVFVDITKGNNGAETARVGPDACTGLGVPIGTALSGIFSDAPIA